MTLRRSLRAIRRSLFPLASLALVPALGLVACTEAPTPVAPDAHAPELATVAATLNFAALDAGDGHTCAVTVSTGKAYCWGYNNSGQLGTGTYTSSTRPVAVAAP